MTRILRIDSSANLKDSVTRGLTDKIVARYPNADITVRDLARTPLPQVTDTWTRARVTPSQERSEEQHAALKLSDELIEELEAADVIVIGAPMYNFTVPASLKAWIDLVARVGVTFRYTETGPEGLLKDRPVIVAFASGGTPLESGYDFHSAYLRFFLNFVGLTNVTFVAADAIATDPEGTMAQAHQKIAALAA